MVRFLLVLAFLWQICPENSALPKMFQDFQSGHFMRWEKIFNESGLWPSPLFVWKAWEPLGHYLSAFCRCYLHQLSGVFPSCRELLLSVDFTQRWMICLVLPIVTVVEPQMEIRFSDSGLMLHPFILVWILQLKVVHAQYSTKPFADHVSCWFWWDLFTES